MDKEDAEDLIHCEICDSYHTGIKPYKQHLHGRRHKKKEQALNKGEVQNTKVKTDEDNIQSEEIMCELCNKKCSSPNNYLQHVKSTSHLRELRREAKGELAEGGQQDDVKLDGDSEVEDDSLIPEPFAICPECKVPFTGPEAQAQHKLGKKHQKQVRRLRFLASKNPELQNTEQSIERQRAASLENEYSGEKIFNCKDCKKEFTEVNEYCQHMKSNSHKMKINLINFKKSLKKEDDVPAVQTDENSDGDSSSDDGDDDDNGGGGGDDENMTCNACSISIKGSKNILIHLNSQEHKIKSKQHSLKTREKRTPGHELSKDLVATDQSEKQKLDDTSTATTSQATPGPKVETKLDSKQESKTQFKEQTVQTDKTKLEKFASAIKAGVNEM